MMIGTTPTSPERFCRRSGLADALAIAVLLLSGACGGSGGGSSTPNPAPTIVTAAFVGATSTPAAGDTLLLFFSEDIQLVAGALLTDDDLTLSDSATLGDVTAAPTLDSARSISVTLGSGVSFTPGTTTITLSASNDVVQDTLGTMGASSTAVTIGTSDGQNPVLSDVTINSVDSELNGTGSAGGTLQVPVNGWALDLTFSDNGAIDVDKTQILASVAIDTTSGTQPAGTNLLPVLTTTSSTSTTARFTVPSTVVFPSIDLILTCTVIDTSGLASAPVTFSIRSRPFTAALQPFETSVNAMQVWYLDFSRDVESFTTSPGGSGVSVDVNEGANGRSDFEDILRILGLNHSAPIPNTSGAKDSNEVARDIFNTSLLSYLAALHSDSKVSFTLTQPGGSFGSQASVPYSTFGYSQISIAGSATSPGVLGVAIFDPSNATQDDNSLIDYLNVRLGIFLHTIADNGLESAASTKFRVTFDPFTPAVGGTAIGADPDDDDRLLDSDFDSRATDMHAALDDFAQFTAVLIAHECGHSMGLVENGAMPDGLYGDDSTNFPGSSDGHIRNTSLFPAGATNVMSPSLSYSNATNGSTAFNTLNLAYLREQVFYGN